ncbi:hypothetical protein ACHQM5_020686 [Ranunculus cassubicifolius]
MRNEGISPSMAMAPVEQRQPLEVHLSGDKSFALHGEIMLVVFILLFASFILFLVFWVFFRRISTPISDNLPPEIVPVMSNQQLQHDTLINLGDSKN